MGNIAELALDELPPGDPQREPFATVLEAV